MKRKIATPDQARQILFRCGADTGEDFAALPSRTVQQLLEWADVCRYRAPKNANGSRGRYFFAYLQRLANRH
jgi:hypothetical protein